MSSQIPLMTSQRQRIFASRKLSATDLFVLKYIYLRNAEIARLAFVTSRSVEECVGKLLRHYKVRTRTALAWKAYAEGFEFDFQYLGKELIKRGRRVDEYES